MIKRILYSVPFIRIAYFITKPFIRKKIWLFCDRTDIAGDNAEQLYSYTVSANNKGVYPVFAISKDSQDYDRLKNNKYRVINRKSWLYILFYLHSDKLISSHADRAVVLNCLGEKYPYLCDLIDYDFIFLSHGINKDDISKLYNKYVTNARIYTVVSRDEQQSMLQDNYGYSADEALLTGFARYDKYDNKPRRHIVIAPTWRKQLASNPKNGLQDREYRDDFVKSQYFHFFQQLISNPRLNSLLEANNITCDFIIHPSFSQQHKDFTETKNIHVVKPPYNYKKILEEASLLITDYSSVAFDFGYMRKPIVYTQFDKDDFYGGHTYTQGFFSYSRNGFGPVTSNVDDTVEEIRKCVANNFSLADIYKSHIDNFFAWSDTHNCRRIYQAIVCLDEEYFIQKSLKRNLKHLLNRTANHKDKINVYWWRYRYPLELNFGDEITRYVIKGIWNIDSVWSPVADADMVGAGSVLEVVDREAAKSNHSITVWGSGFIRPGDTVENENLNIRAVRGELSKSRINSDKEVVLGDPGLLVNKIFPKAKHKKYRFGIVAHYVDLEDILFEKIKKDKQYLLIDPLQTPDKVAYDITSCEYILSSSLHGLIFADSFNIPNNWVQISNKLTGGDYKFEDYYSVTNRKLTKVNRNDITNTSMLNELKKQYQPVYQLKKIQKNLINNFPF